ncbi:MAG: hypothetical protein RR135_05185 [Oscillospiraceae bacterium]
MATSNDNCNAANVFREAVCVDTRRIYDSCGDKDCIKDLQVIFTACAQEVVDAATCIKARSAEAIGVYFEVEPVAFNKGFYSVDMTFFFKITLAAYYSPASAPVIIEGLTTFSKKTILFGSEASVKTFSTESSYASACGCAPIVNVQVIDPMILACRVCDCSERHTTPGMVPPEAIAAQFDGGFVGCTSQRIVCITIGLFSIVQLERRVQVMIPIYDFCVPSKDCTTGTGSSDPCELFDKISFPTDEFFPPRLSELSEE